MKNKNQVIGVLSVLASEVLFGLSFLFTKKVTDTVSPMSLLSWRFLFAFVIMTVCILAGIIKVDFKNKPLKKLLWLSILEPVVYFVCETLGVSMTTASESGTIIASVSTVTLVLTAIVLKELPTKLQTVGVVLSGVGIVLLVVLKGFEVLFNPLGYLLLFGAVVSYSMFSILSVKAQEFTSAEKTYVMMALGAVIFPAVAIVENLRKGTMVSYLMLPFTNREFLISILYLSIGCSVLAFILANKAIAILGTNRAASFVGVCTLTTVFSGVILLKDSFSLLQGGATLVILAGVYLANLTNKEEDLDADADAEDVFA